MFDALLSEASVGVLWQAVQLPLRSLMNSARPFTGVFCAKTNVAQTDATMRPGTTLIAGNQYPRCALTMPEVSSLEKPNRATQLALPYAARV